MPVYYPVADQRLDIGGVIADKNTPYSQTDFSGFSWTEIDGWNQMGAIDQNRQTIDVSLINSDWDATMKGTRAPVDMANRFLYMPSDAGQIALIAAEQSKEFFAFRLRGNERLLGSAKAVTATIASPGVFTSAAHGYANDTAVTLSSTGILPGGIIAGVTYYVVNTATNTFQLAATVGGSAINTTGVQVGTHTVQAVGTPSIRYFAGLVTSVNLPNGEANTAQFLEATIRRRMSIIRIPAIAPA